MTIARREAATAPALRWPLAMALTCIPFLAVAAAEWLSGYAAQYHPWGDFVIYRDAAARWLSGGSFYQPWQLDGPYQIWTHSGAVLYPPPALFLFAPFTVLPMGLWFAIPLAITGWVVVRHRPRPEAWPFLALCIAWPNTMIALAHGNPSMWIVAFVALGTLYGWPAVAVLLKPSLFPFALIGARRRSWWLALAVAGAICIPFGAMWLDWFRAVSGATDVGGWSYSLKEIPTLALPVVAWLGSARPSRDSNPATSIGLATARLLGPIGTRRSR